MYKLLLPVVFIICAADLFGGFYDQFSARMQAIRDVIPVITSAAEEAATVIGTNHQAQIYIPAREGFGFHEEMISRAGGLSQIRNGWCGLDDVVLFAVRDWEELGSDAVRMISFWKEHGHVVIAFASKNGMPLDAQPDFLIDNFAPDGSAKHAHVNALVNVVLGWMWCCEYGAAFSRNGLFPAITKSITPVDSWGHNEGTVAPDGNVRFYKCDVKIPRGDLASVYLYRVRKLLSDICDPHVAQPMAEAVRIISDRLESGHRVAVAGLGHMILEEPKHGLISPMIGFRAVSMLPDSFSNVVDKGDLLVWLTYMGMDSAWDDYGTAIRQSGADLIASYAESVPPSSKEGMLVYIPQSWSIPDAEVAIPVPPYAMAPVSAVNRVLLLRMLDEAVAAELSARNVKLDRKKIARHDKFCNYGQKNRWLSYDRNAVPVGDERWGLLNSNGTVAVEAEYKARFNARNGDEAFLMFDNIRIKIDLKTGEKTETKVTPRNNRRQNGLKGYERSASCGNLTIVSVGNHWGVVAKDGTVKVPAVYDNLKKSSGNTFITQVGEKYGLIDDDGREIVPPVYDMIRSGPGCLSICSNLLFGVMENETGKVLTPPRYDTYVTGFAEYIKGCLNGKFGLFTKTGEVVLPPLYDRIVGTAGENLAIAMQDGKSILVGYNGVAPPFTNRYDVIEKETKAGFFRVRNGRNFGIVDTDGNILLPVEFEQVSESRSSAYGENIASKNGKLCIIDGKYEVNDFPADCDFADPLSIGGPWYLRSVEITPPHWFRAVKNGLWGIVDAAGNEVLPFRYSFVGDMSWTGHIMIVEGGEWRLDAAVSPMLCNGRWGALDRNGKVLIEPKYDALDEAGSGYWNFAEKKPFRPMIP